MSQIIEIEYEQKNELFMKNLLLFHSDKYYCFILILLSFIPLLFSIAFLNFDTIFSIIKFIYCYLYIKVYYII